MSFCEHCAGQRFDRAQVLRALREARRNLPRRGRAGADAALDSAMKAVRALEIPHLESFEDVDAGDVLH